MDRPSSLQRIGRHLLGAFLLFHLFAITALALPAPGGAERRQDWANPTVQAELDAWHVRLAALGLAGDRAAFEDDLFGFAQGFMGLRREVLGPLAPYYTHFGTYQSWRMFVAPHRNPGNLEIRVREDGDWRTVHLARDRAANWLASPLDHHRYRSAIFRYAWGRKLSAAYLALCRWVARRAAVDFPEADAVEIRFRRYTSLSPEQVRAGQPIEWTPFRSKVHDLDAIREAAAEAAP